MKALCYLLLLVFVLLLLSIQIFFAIPSGEGAEDFKVTKIAYIDRDLINYNIVKNIVEELNITVDFIEPNKMHDYDLRNYDLIAIGPLAFDFGYEGGLTEEQIMKIANASKPLLLIGGGPAMIPYLILGRDYVIERKLPAYPLTAHGYINNYILAPSDLEVLSYPYKIDIERSYMINNSGYIKVYETPIGRAAHIYIVKEINGMIIGVEPFCGYATIAIYEDGKIFFAIWTYDQLHGITLDGKKLLANIIYWVLYKSHEYKNNWYNIRRTLEKLTDPIIRGGEEEYFEGTIKGYKWASKYLWGYDTVSTIWGLAVTDDGSYLIVGDVLKKESHPGSVRIYDKNGSLLYYRELDGVVWEVDCDSEGRIFVAADYKGNLLVLQRNQGKFSEKTIKLEKSVSPKGLSLGNNGNTLFVGTDDGYLYVFKINITNAGELTLEKVNELKLGDTWARVLVSVARYSDLGVAATRNGDIFLISPNGDVISRVSISDKIPYEALSTSPEGKYVAVGTGNGHVMLFDSRLRLIWDYDISKNLTSDVNNEVWSVKVSLNGEYVAAASLNGYAYIFDGATGKPLFIFRTNSASPQHGGALGAWTIDISQDGKYAVVGAAEYGGNAYVLARVGDKWEFAMMINTWEAVRRVRISPDGRYIAIGTVDPYATYKRRGLPGLLFYESPIHMVFLNITGVSWELKWGECERGYGGIWCVTGKNVTIEVSPQIVQYSDVIRKVFTSWSGDVISSEPKITIFVNSPMSIIANWKTQYYVKVISEYGDPQGEGWYDEGSEATITISTTKIEGVLYNKVFKGWRNQSGDIVSTSPTYTFTVNQPVVLTAVWDQEPNEIVMLAGSVLVVATAIVLLTIVVVKSRK